MRITEAARRLGTSPRMLRYRDSLGLLPAVRVRPARRPAGSAPAPLSAAAPYRPFGEQDPATAAAGHRQFGERDLDAVALALAIERRYDVSPAALAFGLRVLTEPGVRAEVAELGRRIGRIQAPAARALDFEQERALRLLSMSRHPQRPGAGSRR
jgi:MerR family transcriptional regulator, copper efflux regulator